jgi:hypothetical protein
MNLPKCPNCTRYIAEGTKHLKMPRGWCEVIYQPKRVKSEVVNPKRPAKR